MSQLLEIYVGTVNVEICFFFQIELFQIEID